MPPSRPPRQVLLFSGHRVDAPDRARPRFPADREPLAAAAIADALATLDAGPADLAITQGASGGDLLFAEACLARGVPLRLMQPLAEAAFLAASVEDGADAAAWRARYDAVRTHLAEPPRTLPDTYAAGMDRWEAGNLWMLEQALAEGRERLRLVCLWDGGGGDGPGGTRHAVDAVHRHNGRIVWLDTRRLFGLPRSSD